MKILLLPTLLISVLGLSSCSLLRSATQLPGQTIQTLARTIGFNLQHSEVVGEEEEVQEEVEFQLEK